MNRFVVLVDVCNGVLWKMCPQQQRDRVNEKYATDESAIVSQELQFRAPNN